jgi:hypothetical protein
MIGDLTVDEKCLIIFYRKACVDKYADIVVKLDDSKLVQLYTTTKADIKSEIGKLKLQD